MIHSDNSKSFCNQVKDELCRICGISKTTSTPYHSQGNAIAERVNSVVLNLLGVLPTNQKKFWHKYADLAAYCYNTSVHSSTGYSPFFMLFGRKPRLVGDALLNINLADSIPTTSFSRSYLKNLQLVHQLCHRNQLLLLFQTEGVVEPHLVKNKHITETVSDHVSDHIDTSVVSASHTSTSDYFELAPRLIPSDVDSDSSNTSHPEPHPLGDAPNEFSDYMDSETLSDLEDNQESVAGEVYRTRSGRPSKPPDRYTPSKALLVAVFGKD